MDQIIEGKLFINKQLQNYCIGISDGKIIKIRKTLLGAPRKNFSKKLILPAAIDIHVHFRDPGFVQKENFHTGSIAAAYGGVSCVCDMPNTRPFTSNVNEIKKKDKIAQNKSVVDYGLYAGVTEKNLPVLETLSEFCCGYKVYLGDTTATSSVEQQFLTDLFEKMNAGDKVLAVHAEDNECLKRNKREVNTLNDHVLARPVNCEVTAIASLLKIHRKNGIKLHFCHISSLDALILLENHSSAITLGVTPHHLFFDIGMKLVNPQWFKVNPPIRLSVDRMALWKAFTDGKIDVVESDHAPHTLQEKADGFGEVPSGMPGVETMYPLLLGAVQRDVVSLSSVIDHVCVRPAEVINIPKGRIAIGYDADLCIVDHKKVEEISSDRLHYKSKWTAFEGHKAIFPSDVFIRGNQVISHYEMINEANAGRNIGRKGA
jgi:dihydroorotase